MTAQPAAPPHDTAPSARCQPRHRRARPANRHTPPANRRTPPANRRMLIAGRVMMALAALSVVAATGVSWSGMRQMTSGITTSQALVGVPVSTGGAQNILIMGLDSRLDQHGRPLPPDIYDALHAGDENAGGYNANVLIVLHMPAGGGPVTAISIPRDDYVDLPQCPGGPCQIKIKQAYGLAYAHVLDPHGTGDFPTDVTEAQEQSAREAGRKAEISTVRHLLDIPIDHFIELTLVAFFQIAKAVEPITVCLNADTADSYSGADFHRGVQQINAAQALAFVRQRRDINDEMFTDLDRTRRQQAFIASLVHALRTGDALDQPTTLHNLIDVARQNVAVDARFDLAGFVEHASPPTGSDMSLYTLPITEFGQDTNGEDVNYIDVPTIRRIVHDIIGGGSHGSSISPPPAPAPAPVNTVLNVINATQHDGLAASVEKALADKGFTTGTTTTAATISQESTIEYGHDAADAAKALADQLDLSATASESVDVDTVQLTLGTDFPASDYMGTKSASTETPTTSATPIPTVSATATGDAAPAPTDLTQMKAAAVPCVK
jgi:LCP family protein required for cell wall assembly